MSTGAKRATTKLNQVIAIEKGVKTRANEEISELYKTIQKPDLFTGLVRQYTPNDDEGVLYPEERSPVRENVTTIFKALVKSKSDLYDVTAQKDYANTEAKADVVVDNNTIVTAAPVSYLLFLEKELTDLKNFFRKLPTQDNAETWAFDANSGISKGTPIVKNKTKKTETPVVLYDATEHHPAQTQMVTEDIVEGTWKQTTHTGAIPATEKETLLNKVDLLIKAVKFAREEANQNEAPPKDISTSIFTYLLR